MEDFMENIKDIEGRMQKSVDNLKEEYVTIRAGRANPHILDRLRVDYYGTPTPIQQVANVSVPEARMIQIQPWEASLIKDIEKAILVSDLGLTPNNVPRLDSEPQVRIPISQGWYPNGLSAKAKALVS